MTLLLEDAPGKQGFRPVIDESTGEKYLPVHTRGYYLQQNPLLNKGTAFSEEERDALHLRGYLPPSAGDIRKQLARIRENYSRHPDPLSKYLYLIALQDRNETLFYRFLLDNLEETLPIVYTPTVGAACQQFSHIYRRPRGLYITPSDKDRMAQVLSHVPSDDVAMIVATDGEGILGIGDQGTGGLGIAIGKLTLYTAAAGIHPARCLPICLDLGTNNQQLRDDPLYLGVRESRLEGDAYYDLLDVFVAEVAKRFPRAVVQWEDLSRQKAWGVLERYRDRLCSFNDDIQGTGAVTLAGLLVASRITGRPLKQERYCVFGLGAAGGGICNSLIRAMEREGLTRAEARSRIIPLDSHGPVWSNRRNLAPYKRPFAMAPEIMADWRPAEHGHYGLLDAVRNFRPTVLVGTSGQPGTFNEEVVRAVASYSERPVILALSNPNSKTEVHPEDAFRWTEGRALVATGSPFAPVEYAGKRYEISQGNNVFCFPGIGLGVRASGARRVTDGMLMAAADAVADQVSDAERAAGCLYPRVEDLRKVSVAVARAVGQAAIREGMVPEEAGMTDERLESRLAQEIWYPEYVPYRYVGPL